MLQESQKTFMRTVRFELTRLSAVGLKSTSLTPLTSSQLREVASTTIHRPPSLNPFP